MFQTIVSGVVVFVICQIFIKLVVDPIQGLKTAFSEISQGFRVNIPFLYNSMVLSDDQKKVVRAEILQLAAGLDSRLVLVPLYGFWRLVFFLPSRADINDASQALTAIANWVSSRSGAAQPAIIQNVQSVADLLGIYVSPSSRVNDELLRALIDSELRR